MAVMSKKPQLTWLGKFYVAFRGIKFGVEGQPSFLVHFAFTALAIILACIFHFDVTSWTLLVLCIGLVLMAELFNSAIEVLFRGLPEEVQEKNWPALDIAAGAVLVASIIAAIIGGLLFIPHFMQLFS